MVTETELFETPDLILLCCHSWGWMKYKVYKGEVGTTDELLALILVLLPA
jgi:hypothetical protein